MSDDIVVWLREGTYPRTEAFVLTDADSGNNGHVVSYQAYPDEKPKLDGGVTITGWTLYDSGNNIWRASASGLSFRQLYVNDWRAIRARSPNRTSDINFGPFYPQVYGQQSVPIESVALGDSDERILIRASEVGSWITQPQLEMIWDHHWFHNRLQIDHLVDSGSNKWLYMKSAQANSFWSFFAEDHNAYYFENAYELLDDAGEWYLDETNDYVYYKPRAGENPGAASFVVPTIETLLRIAGASDTSLAHNITVAGLFFQHTTWMLPSDEGLVIPQASFVNNETPLPGAVELQYAQDVMITRNVIRRTGAGGIVLRRNTQSDGIVGNVLYDIGSTGIAVDPFVDAPRTATEIRSLDDVVTDNYVLDCGRDYTSSVGIAGGLPTALLIENNEVANISYTGVSVGWGWSTDPNAMTDIRIQRNKIHDVMRAHDDGAAIYTISSQPNSIWLENYVYNIGRSPWAGQYRIPSLYLDQGSEWIDVKDNVAEGTWDGNVLLSNFDAMSNRLIEGSSVTQVDSPSNQVILPLTFTSASVKTNSGVRSGYTDMLAWSEYGVSTVQSPYGGSPLPLPGTIEAENYDTGGEGIAYHDTTSGNQGDGPGSDDVDIWDAGGGMLGIGWNGSGEWTEYTVSVETGGSYAFDLSAALDGGSSSVDVSVDDSPVGTIGVADTGGWGDYVTFTLDNVTLSAGIHVVRFTTPGGGFNWDKVDVRSLVGNQAPSVSAGNDQIITLPTDTVNLDGTASDDGLPSSTLTTTWSKISGPGTVTFGSSSSVDTTATFSTSGTYVLRLTADDTAATNFDEVAITVNTSGSQSPFGGIAWAVPATQIEAENYDVGGEGVAYHDTDSSNQTSEYRTDGVDVEACGEGGYSIGWIGSGEWLEYSVNATASGNYVLDLRAASFGTSSTVDVYLDGGGSPVASISFSNTGGWQTYQTFSSSAFSLSAGPHVLRLQTSSNNDVNWNWFKLHATGNQPPVVSAGIDQTITLPTDTVNVDGTVSDDGLPSATLTTTWSKVSGPGSVTFGASGSVDTTATFSTSGTYVLTGC